MRMFCRGSVSRTFCASIAFDGNARWLRAWRMRRLHRSGERRDHPRMLDARGSDRWCVCPDDRRPVRQRRNRRSASRLSRSQRTAVRLLHAGNADGRARPAEAAARAEPRPDTRSSFRQLLPLHWLSGDRRCRRGNGAFAKRGRGVTVGSAKTEALLALDRPNSYIGKEAISENRDFSCTCCDIINRACQLDVSQDVGQIAALDGVAISLQNLCGARPSA